MGAELFDGVLVAGVKGLGGGVAFGIEFTGDGAALTSVNTICLKLNQTSMTYGFWLVDFWLHSVS